MNDARMTLRLPGEYLEFAKNYASEREMTLTDLVIGYFKKLKESMVVKGAIFSGDIHSPFLNDQAFEKIAPMDEGSGNRQWPRRGPAEGGSPCL